jgi:hypothetical protein
MRHTVIEEPRTNSAVRALVELVIDPPAEERERDQVPAEVVLQAAERAHVQAVAELELVRVEAVLELAPAVAEPELVRVEAVLELAPAVAEPELVRVEAVLERDPAAVLLRTK